MTAVHDIDADAPHFEHPAQPATTPRRLWRDLGAGYAANGLIGLIFSATGPVAVILAAGTSGGLTAADLASWIAGVFVLNGVITIAMSLAYRQPLGFAWTIPGTILVGSALRELTWPEVIGAFIVTGALILVLGLSGLVRRAMAAVPMPIVMAMVAGVFLTFGTGLVKAVREDFIIAAPMAVVFVALSAMPRLGRWMPPILAALIVGVIAVAVSGRYSPSPASAAVLASPVFTAPAFTWDAAVALVIPLAITVLVVQNGQGVAVLTAAGHKPPINVATVVCGIGSIVAAMVGAVSSCLTGPTNALLTSGGKPQRQYTAAIVFGVLAIGFGLFAPFFVSAMIAAPAAFVAALGGLAMLRALQGAFVTAFSTKFTVGALIAFVVTVADISVANIGAAFWGLVAGIVVSLALERDDWRARKP